MERSRLSSSQSYARMLMVASLCKRVRARACTRVVKKSC